MCPRSLPGVADADPMSRRHASTGLSVREAQDAFELMSARDVLVPVLADAYVTGHLFPPRVYTADHIAAPVGPTTCSTHQLADNAGHDATLANSQRTR
jgi:hypothetical protein